MQRALMFSLKDAEIADLVTYIRQLAGKSSVQVILSLSFNYLQLLSAAVMLPLNDDPSPHSWAVPRRAQNSVRHSRM